MFRQSHSMRGKFRCGLSRFNTLQEVCYIPVFSVLPVSCLRPRNRILQTLLRSFPRRPASKNQQPFQPAAAPRSGVENVPLSPTKWENTFNFIVPAIATWRSVGNYITPDFPLPAGSARPRRSLLASSLRDWSL
jgi:hypothetical protein